MESIEGGLSLLTFVLYFVARMLSGNAVKIGCNTYYVVLQPVTEVMTEVVTELMTKVMRKL